MYRSSRTMGGRCPSSRPPHARPPMGRQGCPPPPPSQSHQLQSSLAGQEVNLITNAYSLKSTQKKSIVHEYKLVVTASSGSKDLSPDLLNRAFVSRSIRKIVMEELLPKLLGTSVPNGSIAIEANLDAIYSSRLLPTNSSTVDTLPDGAFTFKNLPVRTHLLNRLNVDIVLKYSRSLPLVLSDQTRTLVTSILHHKLLLNMLRYGSVYYVSHDDEREGAMQEGRLDLISQHIMGISLSGLRRNIDDRTIVVINCPHAYITRAHRLIDLLATFIAGRPVPQIHLDHSASESQIKKHQIPEIDSIVGSEPWFESFCSILNGYKCQAHGFEEGINLRFDLTVESASKLAMSVATTQTLTVRDHYKQLGINLNYPNLPCLKSRFNRQLYYPLELCSLLPGQKVPIFRLSTAGRNHLSMLNKPKPDLSKRFSSRARDNVVSIGHDEFKSFGISISEEPVEAKGSTLQKPTLLFRNQEIEPQRDFWESGVFHHAVHLMNNWCVVNTTQVDHQREDMFFQEFSKFCMRYGFSVGKPYTLEQDKEDILSRVDSVASIVRECQRLTNGNLRFIMFVIDSSSTSLNRLIHLSFDDHPDVTATCLRVGSIMNERQQRSIFRTLVHKLNARLGGTNVIYHNCTLEKLSLRSGDLMVIGLDVTHPDNELSGVSIVGCAYTYGSDLFRHRSLVWPQTARVEIIGKVDTLMRRLLHEYHTENKGRLPRQIIVYRDGVSHEEFDKVRKTEVSKAQSVLDEAARETGQPKPNLSYIIAQKRHTMRFFHVLPGNNVSNPPSGTLIDQDVVTNNGREFYLYSNTSPQATARPLHYHVLVNGLGIENLQKLTYFLCFNFGKCSGTLSMPSSLRYAHNAAYDARNRVIAAREFSENRFYPSKFFC